MGVDVNDAPSFEEIIKCVETRLKKDTEKEVLQNKINVTAKTERLFLFRILPLPVKQFIFKASGLFFGNSKKR